MWQAPLYKYKKKIGRKKTGKQQAPAMFLPILWVNPSCESIHTVFRSRFQMALDVDPWPTQKQARRKIRSEENLRMLAC